MALPPEVVTSYSHFVGGRQSEKGKRTADGKRQPVNLILSTSAGAA